MAVKKVIAFADEFGNNSFDFSKEGVSTHFIVASVIINANEIDTANAELEKIRQKFFQTGEMKSQKIATNHKRRETILQELTKLNFSIYAVVVDKNKLYDFVDKNEKELSRAYMDNFAIIEPSKIPIIYAFKTKKRVKEVDIMNYRVYERGFDFVISKRLLDVLEKYNLSAYNKIKVTGDCYE